MLDSLIARGGTVEMEHACVNPYCSCEDCGCAAPCTCGLAKVGHRTEEVWDAGVQELRYTVTSSYRPRPRIAGRDGRRHGHGDDGGPEPVAIGEPEELLAESLVGESRHTAVLASHQAVPPPHPGGHSSVRTAVHNGHTIEIRTTYDVRIDGEPLEAHVSVSDNGSVHYHGLPNYAEASAIDLMRRVIDAFPDDYPPAVVDDHGEGG
jgi:hypothetical protein